ARAAIADRKNALRHCIPSRAQSSSRCSTAGFDSVVAVPSISVPATGLLSRHLELQYGSRWTHVLIMVRPGFRTPKGEHGLTDLQVVNV
ncbi:MAG TPA: hypothetical protein VKY31_05065, partial [Terriglobia bacterium]|nr:hypothetical protein [Terriglobia bacterium]